MSHLPGVQSHWYSLAAALARTSSTATVMSYERHRHTACCSCSQRCAQQHHQWRHKPSGGKLCKPHALLQCQQSHESQGTQRAHATKSYLGPGLPSTQKWHVFHDLQPFVMAAPLAPFRFALSASRFNVGATKGKRCIEAFPCRMPDMIKVRSDWRRANLTITHPCGPR